MGLSKKVLRPVEVGGTAVRALLFDVAIRKSSHDAAIWKHLLYLPKLDILVPAVRYFRTSKFANRVDAGI